MLALSVLTDSWVTPMLVFSMVSAMLVLLVQRGKFLYALRNVPYPTALPIIGNAYQLNCSTEGKPSVNWKPVKCLAVTIVDG